ncbi:MAG TPA: hypothetical protein VD927_01260 [Chryseosolibacter sp.]|nr:hypothetical protein [Chryseosolibacter sp.]
MLSSLSVEATIAGGFFVSTSTNGRLFVYEEGAKADLYGIVFVPFAENLVNYEN